MQLFENGKSVLLYYSHLSSFTTELNRLDRRLDRRYEKANKTRRGTFDAKPRVLSTPSKMPQTIVSARGGASRLSTHSRHYTHSRCCTIFSAYSNIDSSTYTNADLSAYSNANSSACTTRAKCIAQRRSASCCSLCAAHPRENQIHLRKLR